MKFRRPQLSYANIIATLALFIALGGTSYAALSLPKNSVGSKQLKKNAVTNTKISKGAVSRSKIRNDAVTSAQVKNNSLTGNDIDEATFAQHAQEAKAGCPISQALAGTKITLDAKLAAN